MVKIVDNTTNKRARIEPKIKSLEEIREEKESMEAYDNECMMPELLKILSEILPKTYSFVEEGSVAIYQRRLSNLFKKKLVASVDITPMNPIFEDRFAVYEDDSRLFDMAREIAKKYETLKGREMTLDVRYII